MRISCVVGNSAKQSPPGWRGAQDLRGREGKGGAGGQQEQARVCIERVLGEKPAEWTQKVLIKERR